MDLFQLNILATTSSAWGLLLVAGVGIAALPWSRGELAASWGALGAVGTVVVRLLRLPRAPARVGAVGAQELDLPSPA